MASMLNFPTPPASHPSPNSSNHTDDRDVEFDMDHSTAQLMYNMDMDKMPIDLPIDLNVNMDYLDSMTFLDWNNLHLDGLNTQQVQTTCDPSDLLPSSNSYQFDFSFPSQLPSPPTTLSDPPSPSMSMAVPTPANLLSESRQNLFYPTIEPLAVSPQQEESSAPAKVKSQSASVASSTAGTAPRPKPAKIASDGPKPKSSHTTIERRYRTNLNTRIINLRLSVPALRILDKPVADKEGLTLDDRGYIDGVKAARKLSKANILGKACEYITVLKNREARLTNTISSLESLFTEHLSSILGLQETEGILNQWRAKQPTEREDELPLDETISGDYEDGDDEGDNEDGGNGLDDEEKDDVDAGRKRKKAKTTAPSKKAAAKVALAPAPVADSASSNSTIPPSPADSNAPKRKRGRPRKNPVPPSAVANTLSSVPPTPPNELIRPPEPAGKEMILQLDPLPISIQTNSDPASSFPSPTSPEGKVLQMQMHLGNEPDIPLQQVNAQVPAQEQQQQSQQRQYLLSIFAFVSFSSSFFHGSSSGSFGSSSSSYHGTGTVLTPGPISVPIQLKPESTTTADILRVVQMIMSALILIVVAAPYFQAGPASKDGKSKRGRLTSLLGLLGDLVGMSAQPDVDAAKAILDDLNGTQKLSLVSKLRLHLLVRTRLRAESKKASPSHAEIKELELTRTLLSAASFGGGVSDVSELVETLRAASVHFKTTSSTSLRLTTLLRKEELRRERKKDAEESWVRVVSGTSSRAVPTFAVEADSSSTSSSETPEEEEIKILKRASDIFALLWPVSPLAHVASASSSQDSNSGALPPSRLEDPSMLTPPPSPCTRGDRSKALEREKLKYELRVLLGSAVFDAALGKVGEMRDMVVALLEG